MVVCSCNIITQEKIKEYFNQYQSDRVPSVGTVIKGMGCNAVCGLCATTIRNEIMNHCEHKEKK
jgi:bacterioferritin-associated ferredoxin